MGRLLAGKTAIVTGAASGIGQAIAALFHAEGAAVLASDLTLPVFPGLEGDARMQVMVLDVTADDAPGILAGQAERLFDSADILVNNAGICIPGSIEDQSLESWNKVFAVNVTAPFRLTQAIVPMMKAKRWGRIINLGSIMSDFGGPSLCAYGSSKHAVAGLTKSMAVDLGGFGITANYLQPSAIWTGMSRPFMDDPDFRAYWEGKAPAGYIGEPEDVAAPALFLASEASRFVSGMGFRICGGAMARF